MQQDENEEQRPAKKRKVHGGGWRAYVHVRGQGTHRPDFKALSEEYNALPEAEKASYAEMGRQASAVARDGEPAFPRTHRVVMRERQRCAREDTLDAILAGWLAATIEF